MDDSMEHSYCEVVSDSHRHLTTQTGMRSQVLFKKPYNYFSLLKVRLFVSTNFDLFNEMEQKYPYEEPYMITNLQSLIIPSLFCVCTVVHALFHSGE